MKDKFTVYSLQFIVLLAFFLLLLLSPVTYNLKPILAQTQNCGGTGTTRATGLVSTPQLQSGSKFGTTGGCVINPRAAFTPFKIPSYNDLKSLYFDQSKTTKANEFKGDAVYKTGGDFNVTNPSGSGTAIAFVEGNLNINNDYTYGNASGGTVFVVKGNVNIAQSVGRVDAVIISEGIICTASQSGICPSSAVTSQQLVVNGSLISLNDGSPIRFRRTLSDNSQPAERINHQVKYLVILRNLLSDTIQKWSEISAETIIPTPGPTTIPIPIPIAQPPPAISTPTPTPFSPPPPPPPGSVQLTCLEQQGIAQSTGTITQTGKKLTITFPASPQSGLDEEGKETTFVSPGTIYRTKSTDLPSKTTIGRKLAGYETFYQFNSPAGNPTYLDYYQVDSVNSIGTTVSKTRYLYVGQENNFCSPGRRPYFVMSNQSVSGNTLSWLVKAYNPSNPLEYAILALPSTFTINDTGVPSSSVRVGSSTFVCDERRFPYNFGRFANEIFNPCFGGHKETQVSLTIQGFWGGSISIGYYSLCSSNPSQVSTTMGVISKDVSEKPNQPGTPYVIRQPHEDVTIISSSPPSPSNEDYTIVNKSRDRWSREVELPTTYNSARRVYVATDDISTLSSGTYYYGVYIGGILLCQGYSELISNVVQ